MDEIVDTKTIEEFFGISGRTVRDLAAKGVIAKSGHGKYDLKLSITSYVDYKVNLAIQSFSKDDVDYLEARRRNELAKAMMGEIALDKEQGKLVDAKDMELGMISLFNDIKTRLRAIPARCSDVIADNQMEGKSKVELRSEINESLRSEIDESLEELSQWKPQTS